jgi:DNA (cytosine-5)-methyltransferase 1
VSMSLPEDTPASHSALHLREHVKEPTTPATFGPTLPTPFAFRPRGVMLENVPGHLGLGFGNVIGDLASLGYDTEWDCIPAAALGASHRRDRVFVIAYPNCNSQHVRPVNGKASSTPESVGWPAPARAWASEPGVGRMAHGIPSQMDRLRGLGNAVVPQVAEHVGRILMQILNNTLEER